MSEPSKEVWYRDLPVSHRSYRAPHSSQLQPSHNLSLPKCWLCFQQSKRIRPDRASKCSPFPRFRTPVVLRQDGKIMPSLLSALHSMNLFLCYDSQAERDFPLQFNNKLFTLQGEAGAWNVVPLHGTYRARRWKRSGFHWAQSSSLRFTPYR